MKQILDDESFLKIAIVAAISIIMIIIFLEGNISLLTSRIAAIFLFYGFVVVGKKFKNIWLVATSYLIMIWSAVYIIGKFILNLNIPSGTLFDWILALVFSLSLLKTKKIKLIPKITALYYAAISIMVIIVEVDMKIFLGLYAWAAILSLTITLLAATLYQYLQSMKPRRRRKK